MLVHFSKLHYPGGYTDNHLFPTSINGNNITYIGKNIEGYGEYTYKYNEQGIRVNKSKTNYNIDYIIENNKIVKTKETKSGIIKSVEYHYDEHDMLVGLTYNDKEYFYDRDVLGNINRIIDITGKEYVRYKYTAYGEVIKEINSSLTTSQKQIANTLKEINIFLYKGYCYDEETNLYYCNSRYYSPILCRWITPDNADYLDPESINGLNLYAYCGNNPVNYKQRPVSSGGSVTSSSISSISNGGTYLSGSISSGSVGSSRVDWENGGFQIPIWISSLMSGSDFGASIAPALRTIYQYIRYPGVKDLNKLYGLDFVPGKLNAVCSAIGYGLLGLNIGLSAWSNFTNDNLTTKQQWISFGVDTAYTLGTFGIGYGVGALVSLIPGVGVFIAPFVSAGVTWFIDWTNEKWGWLDDVKQWFNDL